MYICIYICTLNVCITGPIRLNDQPKHREALRSCSSAPATWGTSTPGRQGDVLSMGGVQPTSKGDMIHICHNNIFGDIIYILMLYVYIDICIYGHICKIYHIAVHALLYV